MKLRVAIVGGGAAGYFAALACRKAHPECEITLFEAASKPLAKVRISGGGRCNVTTSIENPHELVKHFPRGSRELLGPFTRFGPRDVRSWFESRGVHLKTESDGRVFPVTDSSDTITSCLEQAAAGAGVRVFTRSGIRAAAQTQDGLFRLGGREGETFNRLLLCPGSAQAGYDMARSLGHTLVPCVPSLFSFVVKDARLSGLQGVSVPRARLQFDPESRGLEATGPLLVTHWGLSGPAVLRLSAWGARRLAESDYKAPLLVDWLPQESEAQLLNTLLGRRARFGASVVATDNPTPLPSRLWTRLVHHAEVRPVTTWSSLRREDSERLVRQLKQGSYLVTGRGEFKEEFVTAGGVDLREVDFRTMESKVCRGLYLAGEILDIDGLTGGFNLQAAWTTGYLAGTAMGSTLLSSSLT